MPSPSRVTSTGRFAMRVATKSPSACNSLSCATYSQARPKMRRISSAKIAGSV
jgi:hypothetical protein